MMSEAMTAINFAFADGTTKNYSLGPFALTSDAIANFKNRVQNFNSVDETAHKKITNLFDCVVSENGAAITGVKTASITVSNVRRIFDAATYTP